MQIRFLHMYGNCNFKKHSTMEYNYNTFTFFRSSTAEYVHIQAFLKEPTFFCTFEIINPVINPFIAIRVSE